MSTVCFQMYPQIACLRRGKVTLVALVRLFSTVYFEMTSQAAFHRRCILTLVALLWFFFIVICVSQGIIFLDPPLTKVIIYKILIHHHKVGNVVPCVLSVSNWKKWVEDKWKWESFLNIILKIIIEDNHTWYLSATPRECKQFQVSVLIHTQRVVLYTLHIVCNFTHCV